LSQGSIPHLKPLFGRDSLRERPRLACLVAFISGCALVAAYSPLDLSPLGLVAPALLIHLWLCAARARDCAWIGFSFGMGLFVTGVSWVYVSLSLFGGMPAALAAFATLLYCAWLALLPAAVGYAQHRPGTNNSMRAFALIPGLWMISEWVRGWYFTGFPWLTLGYAATDTPLAGFAPLAGVYGVSLIGMVCAALVWAIVARPKRTIPLAALAAILSAGALLRACAPVGTRFRSPSSGGATSAACTTSSISICRLRTRGRWLTIPGAAPSV